MLLLLILNLPLLISLELESDLPLWVWIAIAAIVIIYVSFKIGEAINKKVPLHSTLFKLPDLDRAGCLTSFLVTTAMISVVVVFFWLYLYLHDTLSLSNIIIILLAVLLVLFLIFTIAFVHFFKSNRVHYSVSKSLRFAFKDIIDEIVKPLPEFIAGFIRYIVIGLIYLFVLSLILGVGRMILEGLLYDIPKALESLFQ